MRELPMFPLGLVLLPGMVLPLRLFEPRYLQMYADIIDSDREFGVVLIERGIESRDDNPTFDIGCVAHVVGSGLNDDGTVGLVTMGRTRIRVTEWLPSDPYPLAVVEDLADEQPGPPGDAALLSARRRLPELISLAGRLNPGSDYEVPDLSDDPTQSIYQLAQIAGLQTLDLQRVLETPTTDQRAALVDELIEETEDLLRLQLKVDE
ncbi:MAG: LON peptidase substrate-binding domain-containing protein [Acidimicrobiia bacterium]